MLRRIGLRVASVAVASAVPVVTLALPAWAPRYILGASAFGDCRVDGLADSRFQGAFTVLSFSVADGQLQVTGNVGGTCADGAGIVVTVPAEPFTFPVLSTTASCDPNGATVQFVPGATTVGGVLGDDTKDGEAVKFTLDLSRATILERTWSPGDPRAVHARLCALDRILDHREPADLLPLLDNLLLG